MPPGFPAAGAEVDYPVFLGGWDDIAVRDFDSVLIANSMHPARFFNFNDPSGVVCKLCNKGEDLYGSHVGSTKHRNKVADWQKQLNLALSLGRARAPRSVAVWDQPQLQIANMPHQT